MNAQAFAFPTECQIIYPADSAPCGFAAKELASFLTQSEAVKSCILQSTSTGGDCQLVISGDLQTEEVNYIISDKGIRISSGSERGLLYAVWEFCERELGVRFLTADHTHIEKWRKGKLINNSYTFIPPIKRFRRSYYGEILSDHLFATRLRQHIDRLKDKRLGAPTGFKLINHTLHNYVSTREYSKDHPEYFALIDNQRRSHPKEDWGGMGTQLCHTNSEVFDIVLKKTLADLRNSSVISSRPDLF